MLKNPQLHCFALSFQIFWLIFSKLQGTSWGLKISCHSVLWPFTGHWSLSSLWPSIPAASSLATARGIDRHLHKLHTPQIQKGDGLPLQTLHALGEACVHFPPRKSFFLHSSRNMTKPRPCTSYPGHCTTEEFTEMSWKPQFKTFMNTDTGKVSMDCRQTKDKDVVYKHTHIHT